MAAPRDARLRQTTTDAGDFTSGAGDGSSARTVEQDRLREALAVLKGDVSELAAREVETALLQQRIARLEMAVEGHPVLSIGRAGRISQAGGMGAAADVELIASRLTDMEYAVRDLTSALDVGGRLQRFVSPEPGDGDTGPGWLCSSGGRRGGQPSTQHRHPPPPAPDTAAGAPRLAL